MLPHLDDDQLEVRQGRLETRRGDNLGGLERPVAAAGETSGEDAHVVGKIGDRERRLTQIVERGRGVKRRQNPESPSAISPKGAICGSPCALIVITIASRISGITRSPPANAACGLLRSSASCPRRADRLRNPN